MSGTRGDGDRTTGGAASGQGAGGYFDRANPYIHRMLEPGHRRVLEVGCGAAALGGTWKAADPSLEVWGLELDPWAAKVAGDRIDRVLTVDLDGLEALPPEAGLFDLITFGDVLEHLRDPGRLLSVLANHLSAIGEVVACVPNVCHWTVISQLLQGRFDYENEGLLDRTHIHLFTPTTFRQLLESVGLRAITYIESIAAPGPFSGQLAQFGAALAGAPDQTQALIRDFDTYQMVFRARRPVIGPVTRFVAVAEDTASVVEAAKTMEAFQGGFRAGEPVRLTILATEAGLPLADHNQALEGLARPPVEVLSVPSTAEVPERVRVGADRVVAVGRAAGAALPEVTVCEANRLSMLGTARG